MKRIVPILLALLLLAACGGKPTPSSSQKDPASGGGLVVSQPTDDPGEPEPEPDEGPDDPGEPDPAPDPDPAPPSAEDEAPAPKEDPEDGPSNQFVTTLTDVNGQALPGTATFSIEFPDDWTVSGNAIYDEEGRQIAEILPSIPFEDESVYNTLAQRYPDSGTISVTVGGLSGNCFYDEVPMPNDPDFPTGFKSEIVYYLERGDELFCMRFIPLYSVGVGNQRENFQAQIREIK